MKAYRAHIFARVDNKLISGKYFESMDFTDPDPITAENKAWSWLADVKAANVAAGIAVARVDVEEVPS